METAESKLHHFTSSRQIQQHFLASRTPHFVSLWEKAVSLWRFCQGRLWELTDFPL